MFCSRRPITQSLRLLQISPRCFHNSTSLFAATGVRRRKRREPSKTSVSAKDGELAAAMAAQFKAVSIKNFDRFRVSVVNPDLCDDVIQRLSPSLTKHENCDIIDLNPGPGLFSSKLHERLKPRKHILMEPDADVYEPFLKPLLEAPNSKYELIERSGLLWDELVEVLNPKYLPHQTAYESNDPRLNEPNNSLLVVANLGFVRPRNYMGHKSMSRLMVNQLVSAIPSHSIFQKYGLVRMLIWVDDQEKLFILPRGIERRRRAAIEAELSCESIQEVAGGGQIASRSQRIHALELQSAINVQERMKRNNIVTPPSRIGPLEHELVNGPAKVSELEEQGKNYETTTRYLKELAELEQQWKNREFVSCYLPDGTPYYSTSELDRFPNGSVPTGQMLRLRELRSRAKASMKRGVIIEDLLAQYDVLEERGRALKDDSSFSAVSKKAALEEDRESWRKLIDKLPMNDRRAFWLRLEDHKALNLEPPTLYWDRREYEPLIAKETEFFPRKELALLDLQPKAPWAVLEEPDSNSFVTLEFIITTMLMFPSAPLAQTLQSMAPGALEYLIEECPSLQDASKGGCVDMWAAFGVRGITQPMLKEIIEAWMRWTFKPTTLDMMARMGLQGLQDAGGDSDMDRVG